MTQGHSTNPASGKIALLGIALLAAVYAGAINLGLPQHGTQLIKAAAEHHDQVHHGHDDGARGLAENVPIR